MKKYLLFIAFAVIVNFGAAQVPQGFAYQVVVRNSNGETITNQMVSFRLSLTGPAENPIYFTETHSATTSSQGIVNLVVGEGVLVLGNLAAVPWENGNIDLKVELDPAGGSSYALMGNVPLKSVPYALYAPQSGTVASNPEASDEDPIFVVRNKEGQIVFAVYQSGVRMYVDESTSKNARGGFAIGGIGDNLKEGTEYFRVTPDSVRVNLREPVGKNARGGFAIGGIGDNLKVQPSNLFYIGQDSARIYINTDAPSGPKNARGGFAIGGIGDNLKGNGPELMRVTKDSTRVYVSPGSQKNARGGFAIGGIGDNLKSQPSNFMFVGEDSTRIYINTTNGKNSRGGFAIGGIGDNLKGSGQNFFNVATDTTGTISPSESRILWYPVKNAFLAGKVLVESPDSVGTNSFSTGYESKSIGLYSQSMGYMSKSKGDFSTAIGKKAESKGTNSFAFGDSAIAKGVNSYALGNKALATGDQSFAIGSWTRESPYSSVLGTEALGVNSIAIGIGAKARAGNSISIGSSGTYSIPPYPMPIYSTNNANGESSLVIGFGNSAETTYGILIGRGNKSLSDNGMAFGYQNTASGEFSYAFGHGNKTIGANSTAIGYYTIAKDNQSTIVGAYNDTTLNNVQFAVGYGTRVMSSVTRRNAITVFKDGGIRLNTSSMGSDNIELNVNNTGNRSAFIDFHGDDVNTDFSLRVIRYSTGENATSRIHHMGTGSMQFYNQNAAPIRFYTNGSERFTILSTGNVGVGNSNPASYKLDITGTVRATLSAYFATSSGRVGIGLTYPLYKLDILDSSTDLFAAKIFKDSNNSSHGGLMVQAGTDTGTGTNMMLACYNGAGTYKGGLAIVNNGNVQLVTSSDIKLKRNINSTSLSGLDLLKKLRVVDFEYYDTPGKKQIGYIAQEVKDIFPEMVSFNEIEGIYQISQMQLIPVFNKAIQEQQAVIEKQQTEIEILKTELEAIKAMLMKK